MTSSGGPDSKLVIEMESSPFEHRINITLTGVRGTPDLALSRRVGIFGNVRNQ